MHNVDASAHTRAFPPELNRWNWGAFGLNWIWGIAHKSYFTLLVFVPFVGVFIPFLAGARGNRWAWQNGHWASLEAFQRAQKRWARYTLIAYGIAAVSCVAIAFTALTAIEHSDAYTLADARLRTDPSVARWLGSPIKTGFVMGRINTSAGGIGEADLSVPVTGPKAKGTAYVKSSKRAGAWTIETLKLVLADGQPIVIIPVEAPPAPRVEAGPRRAEPEQAKPKELPDLDVPTLRAHVNDDAHMLSRKEAKTLEAKLKAYEKKTGQQFAMLTVPTLNGADIRDFGFTVANRWALGRAGYDDGVLVVVAPYKIDIEVGKGLERAISDEAAKRIIDEQIAPAFRVKHIAAGLHSAFDELIAAAHPLRR